MTLYIGIDPGAKGGIAGIDELGNVCMLHDWPGDEIQASKIFWDIVDYGEENHEGRILAAVEHVHAIPMKPLAGGKGQGMSSTSSFNFGKNWGMHKMALAMAGIPFLEPKPQAWQKGMFKKADGKNAAMAVAGRLFPDAEIYGPRGGNKDGRADALLIAEWRRRQV